MVAPHPDDEALGAGGLIIRCIAAGLDRPCRRGRPMARLPSVRARRRARRRLARRRRREQGRCLERLTAGGTGVLDDRRLALPDGEIAAHERELEGAPDRDPAGRRLVPHHVRMGRSSRPRGHRPCRRGSGRSHDRRRRGRVPRSGPGTGPRRASSRGTEPAGSTSPEQERRVKQRGDRRASIAARPDATAPVARGPAPRPRPFPTVVRGGVPMSHVDVGDFERMYQQDPRPLELRDERVRAASLRPDRGRARAPALPAGLRAGLRHRRADPAAGRTLRPSRRPRALSHRPRRGTRALRSTSATSSSSRASSPVTGPTGCSTSWC